MGVFKKILFLEGFGILCGFFKWAMIQLLIAIHIQERQIWAYEALL